MEERVVYGKANVHKAWDIASSAQSPVYSTCDGTIEKVSFPYSSNSIDTNDKQGGNIIKLSCEVGDKNTLFCMDIYFLTVPKLVKDNK